MPIAIALLLCCQWLVFVYLYIRLFTLASPILTCKTAESPIFDISETASKVLESFPHFSLFRRQSRFPIFILPEDRLSSEIFSVVSPLYVNRTSCDLHQCIALVRPVSTRCYMPRYSLKTRPAHAY